MKKYSLTIIYDEDKEEISSVKQQIVDLNSVTAPKQLKVDMNVKFAECLPDLSQDVINALFQSADDSGGLMGDA